MNAPAKTTRRPARRLGYTFVEVLVALAILGISIGGAYRLLISAMRTRTLMQDQYIATVLANNRVESAKNAPFESLITFRELNSAVDEMGLLDAGGDYTRSTTVQTSWSGNPRVTRVEVMVQAPALPGVSQGPRVRVATLLTEYEEP